MGGFTLSSLFCGLALGEGILLTARGVQGVSAAGITSASLALIANLFVTPEDRAKAMAWYGCVCAAGGGVGDIVGGYLTQTFGWQSIFLVNIPIGMTVVTLSHFILPLDGQRETRKFLDIWGALTITAALTMLVYCLVNGNEAGWLSMTTLGMFGAGLGLFLVFLTIQALGREPLLPVRLLLLRNLMAANAVGALWAAGNFGWFVISALYLQRVLGYEPLHVGLAFIPAEIVMAAFSLGFGATLVVNYGFSRTLSVGLLLAAGGLAFFARAPVSGVYLVDVLPGMLLLGLGAGMVSTPLLAAAMSDTDSDESGIASGMINTSFMLGGAVGLAILVSCSEYSTDFARRAGLDSIASLNAGYHVAFFVSACLAGAAAALGALAFHEQRWRAARG
jgi:hypothetical protein